MPDSFSKNIVYLSEAQRQELFANDTITVNGVTVTYNENDIYVTPQVEPITDVRMNGTSIGSNGIADIPKATNSSIGVVQLNSNWGITNFDQSGKIGIARAADNEIKLGIGAYKPIVPTIQHRATFYGLSKVAGVDLADETVTLGTYPDTSKAAIQNMLGISDLIGNKNSNLTASKAYSINDIFTANGKLYKATAAIAQDGAIVVEGSGANCEETSVVEGFVKKTDYATALTVGLVKTAESWGTIMQADGTIALKAAVESTIKAAVNSAQPIVSSTQHIAVFYGLAKAAGVDLASETATVGTYSTTAQAAIRTMLGAAAASDIPSVPVQDVKIDNTSVLSNGIANIPYADTTNSGGIVRANNNFGIAYAGQGLLAIECADATLIKAGNNAFRPIVPYFQHNSVFYGLSKAAGVDLAETTATVGTYPDTSKAAIRTMIGATSPDVIAVQDTQPTNTDNKIWMPETAPAGIQVPTMSDLDAYVLKTDYASSTAAGIVQISKNDGVAISSNAHTLYINAAASDIVKAGANDKRPIVPSNQHESVYFGLSKAAGVDLASETATVGTYSSTASAAIRSMLGAVGDVQVNGTSVVSSGVANIPLTSGGVLGVASVNDGTYGLTTSNGNIRVSPATVALIKAGTETYTPITPVRQHNAVFYGLAKAAGDTTQSASSNSVGTYTSEAKAAIQSMLGIDLSSIAQQVEIPLVETISSTTPSITGQPNTRYVCGEVSTISITPPASGSVDVIFESGSTAALLTVPNTVKWPAWFDATSLETNTTYELLITDGVYGSVMTWAT